MLSQSMALLPVPTRHIVAGFVWVWLSGVLFAETSIGGKLSGDVHWKPSGNPYVVNQNLEVPLGSQLTIHPGVRIYLKDQSIIIRGKLIARGTEKDPILFTSSNLESPAPMDWGQFAFDGAGSGATHDSQYRYVSGSILEFVTIEYGGGLVLNQAAPAIIHCTIRHHRKKRGGGIYAHGCVPVIRDSIISSNTAEESGGGIRTAYCQPILINNTIIHNSADDEGGGISIDHNTAHIEGNTISYNFALRAGGISTGDTQVGQTSVTGQSTSRPKILRNRITNNRAAYFGGGIMVEGTPVITDNIIAGNRIQLASFDNRPSSSSHIDRKSGTGGGIRVVETYGGPLSIQRNVIAGNRGAFWGGAMAFGRASGSVTNNIVVGNQALLHGGAVSILVETSSKSFMGNGHGADWDFTGNQMRKNSGGVFELAQARFPGRQTIRVRQSDLTDNDGDTFYNGTSIELQASSNYWGTTDTAAIGERIHDFYDNNQLGRIHVSPAQQPVAIELPKIDPSSLAFLASCPEGIRAGQGFNRLPDTPPSVTIVWNEGSLAKPAGYLVYLSQLEPRFDEISRKDSLRVTARCNEGESVVDVGNTNRVTLSGFTVGSTYEFFVTAYDFNGQESSVSDACVVKVEL